MSYGKIHTIKAIRDMIKFKYGTDALRKAKEIYENSFDHLQIIVTYTEKNENNT